MSLMLKVDEPQLEAIYGWLEQRTGATVQLFGWESGQKAALLAYGAAADPFGWANWITKIAQDPSTLVPLFEQLELVVDEATISALTAAFPGAFNSAPRPRSFLGG